MTLWNRHALQRFHSRFPRGYMTFPGEEQAHSELEERTRPLQWYFKSVGEKNAGNGETFVRKRGRVSKVGQVGPLCSERRDCPLLEGDGRTVEPPSRSAPAIVFTQLRGPSTWKQVKSRDPRNNVCSKSPTLSLGLGTNQEWPRRLTLNNSKFHVLFNL